MNIADFMGAGAPSSDQETSGGATPQQDRRAYIQFGILAAALILGVGLRIFFASVGENNDVKIITGVKFNDGVEQQKQHNQNAA